MVRLFTMRIVTIILEKKKLSRNYCRELIALSPFLAKS